MEAGYLYLIEVINKYFNNSGDFMENKNVKMEKNIGVSSAILVVVGGIIGSGVFFKPQAIYTASGGAPGIGMLSWIVAGLITLCGALTVSELAVFIPKTGGMVVYIREIYGEKLGFLAGWVQVLLYFPGMIAALAVIFSDQFVLMSGLTWAKLPMTLLVLLIFTIVNLMGNKQTAILGNVSTVFKIAVLVIIIVVGLFFGKNNQSMVSPFIGKDVNVVTATGKILLAIFFAFDGWINVCALAGEMKNPAKDLSKAMLGGLSIVLAIYILINIAFLKVLPATVLANSVSPGLSVSNELFGELGGKIIGIGIMISVFGCGNSFAFTGSRVMYALAEEKIIPKSDKLLNLNKNNVPKYSIIAITFVAAIYALSGQFNLLTDFAIFSIWIFIVLTFVAVFKNRKNVNVSELKFKIPMYPIVPIIAIVGGLFVLVVQLITSPLMSIGSIAILLLGIPIYSIGSKKRIK